jgi:hypothetical protein
VDCIHMSETEEILKNPISFLDSFCTGGFSWFARRLLGAPPLTLVGDRHPNSHVTDAKTPASMPEHVVRDVFRLTEHTHGAWG